LHQALLRCHSRTVVRDAGKAHALNFFDRKRRKACRIHSRSVTRVYAVKWCTRTCSSGSFYGAPASCAMQRSISREGASDRSVRGAANISNKIYLEGSTWHRGLSQECPQSGMACLKSDSSLRAVVPVQRKCCYSYSRPVPRYAAGTVYRLAPSHRPSQNPDIKVRRSEESEIVDAPLIGRK